MLKHALLFCALSLVTSFGIYADETAPAAPAPKTEAQETAPTTKPEEKATEQSDEKPETLACKGDKAALSCAGCKGKFIASCGCKKKDAVLAGCGCGEKKKGDVNAGCPCNDKKKGGGVILAADQQKTDEESKPSAKEVIELEDPDEEVEAIA